ncbi:MAG: GSCFA domain-containing protein [Bacteroidales bacterium]
MKKTITKINIEPINQPINHDDKIISLGSCFSSDIGYRLADNGFNILNNPFGVLYNPISIKNSLERLFTNKPFTLDDIIKRDPFYGRKKDNNNKKLTNNQNSSQNLNLNHRNITHCIPGQGYTSFYHHGSFTKPTPEEFLENANKKLEEAHNFFNETDYIIITFGTAWVYRHIEKDIIVSNCHKHLAKEFNRELLDIETILNAYSNFMYFDLTFHPKRKWIFTVSPIRHLKDGLHRNQISKSILLLAIDKLVKRYPNNYYYFPSYEIILDELRDYSNFADNLIHPNKTAIDYVWERFKLYCTKS